MANKTTYHTTVVATYLGTGDTTVYAFPMGTPATWAVGYAKNDILKQMNEEWKGLADLTGDTPTVSTLADIDEEYTFTCQSHNTVVMVDLQH